MNEMLYGNNGQNDECLNVDMDQALFARVKSKTFVHAVRKVLNPLRPIPDNSFVYIGSVEEKGNAYTLYGYQAKLKNDSRGGDYGNYIALPCDRKKAVLAFQNVKFSNEEGFREFYTASKIGDSNRFSVEPVKTPLNKNALKLLVNNMLEMFMGTGKISTVSFSFSNEADENFSAKSIYVLAVAMKYLPYKMRKNIAFISRVDANAKVPNMINVAAFASNNSAKPRDCIDVEHECGELTTGVFKNYVNKVFDMDKESLEAYLEQLYTEIEYPLTEKNLVVRGGHYLLDTETKPLWKTGSDEAIKDIFATTNEVATVFPAYTALAKKVIEENSEKVMAYLSKSIAQITKIEEIKKLYTNTKNLFTACSFDITKTVLPLFVEKTDELFKNVDDKEKVIVLADTVKGISTDLFGAAAKAKLAAILECDGLNSFFEEYGMLKSKGYMPDDELNEISNEKAEKIFSGMLLPARGSKDKLDILNAEYKKFEDDSQGRDISIVTSVYNKYKTELSGSANSEAMKSGSAILKEITDNLKYYNEFSYFPGYFEKLVKIDVSASSELKAKTERVYAEVVDRLYRWLIEKDVSGRELTDAIDRISLCVNKMESRDIFDGRPMMLSPVKKGVPDGISRLMNVFKSFKNALTPETTLSDALIKFDELNQKIMPTETRSGTIFKKYAPVIFKSWACGGRYKKCSAKDLEGALKKLNKKNEVKDERSIVKFIERFSAIPNEKSASKKGKVSIIPIVIAIAALIAVGAAVGILFKMGIIGNGGAADATDATEVTEIEAKYVDSSVISDVYEYLDSFKTEAAPNSAEIKVGEIYAQISVGGTEAIIHYNQDNEQQVIFQPTQNSKNFIDPEDIPKKQKCVFVMQTVVEGEKEICYVRDAVLLPAFENYDVEKGFEPPMLKYIEGDDEKNAELFAFYNKIVQYTGVKEGKLTLEQGKAAKQGEAAKQGKTAENGSMEGSQSGKNVIAGDKAGAEKEPEKAPKKGA